MVKFKPIYLSGKLVEASLSLYSVRLKMTNTVGLKPWDEVWAKQNLSPKTDIVVVSRKDKQIPRVWSV